MMKDSSIQSSAALIWGLGLLIPLCIWFLRRVRRFSPHDIDETMTLEQAIAAIREAEANPLVQSDRERTKKERTNSDSDSPVPPLST
jgi:Tfp pilus assembly protein PilX